MQFINKIGIILTPDKNLPNLGNNSFELASFKEFFKFITNIYKNFCHLFNNIYIFLTLSLLFYASVKIDFIIWQLSHDGSTNHHLESCSIKFK